MSNTLPPVSHLTSSLNVQPPKGNTPLPPVFYRTPQSSIPLHHAPQLAPVPVWARLPEPYYELPPPQFFSGPLLVQYSLGGPPAAQVNQEYRFVEDRPRKKQRRDPQTLVFRFQDSFKESYKHGKRLFPNSQEKYPVTPLQDAVKALPAQIELDLRENVYPSIVTKKYSALALGSNRSHLLVYEYPLATQWVIWDYETGYTHLTGLWRAALHEHALHKNKDGVVHVKPNAKADIVKLLELTPQALHPYIKRVRGGFLKIQGTWVPHSLCKRLARSFCYYVRYQLVPIFGADFPDLCLRPDDPGFGELRFDVCGDDFTLDTPAGLELCPISPTQATGQPNHSHSDSAEPRHRSSSTHSEFNNYSTRPNNERLGSILLQPSFLLASYLTNASLVEILACNSSPQLTASLSDGPAKRDDGMSYADMVDIVNASKCLQRLRQGLGSDQE